MPDKKVIKRILNYSAMLLILFIVFLITLLAVNAGKQPDLRPWHYMSFQPDSLTTGEYSSFEGYLAAEKEYINSIYDSLAGESTEEFSKYTESDVFFPVINGENLNASFIFEPRGDDFKGGVLLAHGLSDSPYHMRRIGEFLSDEGYYVIGIRLPGHGTVPSALLDIHWQDWYQAVEFASAYVEAEISRRGSGAFIMGGFSTGAALNLRYTLERIIAGDGNLPDKLLFFSPAFGITKFAELTNWHKLVSWIPLFYKFKWQSIEPEYDPYCYTSWPFNAGYQIFKLSEKNWDLVNKISSKLEYLDKVPPMIAFQSRVDATVIPERVYELFDLIAPGGSQLFIYDVNRRYQSIISDDILMWSVDDIPGERVGRIITIVPEDGNWSESVYAVSHLCVPLSPGDAVYGENSLIGGLSLKGERGVLGTGINLDRLRYNPFFSHMEEMVLEFVSR